MKVNGLVRLTKKPERKDNTVKLSIAWNDWKREGNFFNAVAFGKTGDLIEKVNKGDRIYIAMGRLTSTIGERDGKSIQYSNIIIDQFEYIEPKERSITDFVKKEIHPQIEVQEDDLPF